MVRRWTGAGKPRRSGKPVSKRYVPELEPLEVRRLLSSSIPLGPHNWTALGPASLSADQLYSGRITGIAPDPRDPNVLYIAAASGGVWKTSDGGGSWLPLTDNQATLFMGAIAVAPNNPGVIYAGTGEANLGPSKLALRRDNIYYGFGILRSLDAGATWTLVGQTPFFRRTISKIVVDPQNAAVVYAAVGAEATNGLPGNTGIWKSIDAGATWVDMTASISTTAAFSDVAIDPQNDQILYAAVGQPGGDAANGVYVSVNGGATWSVAGNFPTGAIQPSIGRISLALAPSAPQVVYASVAASGLGGFAVGTLRYFARSFDGGVTWSLAPNTPDYMAGFGDYDTSLAVNPFNSGEVYAGGQAGGLTLIRSFDAGNSWSDIDTGVDGSGPHVDHHAAAFDAAGRFLDGNDGGIWRLDDPNPSTLRWTDLNSNLNTIQFTGIALNPTNPDIAYGGSQDNGTERFNNSMVWSEIQGGDGGFVRVDPNTGTVYHTFFYQGDGFLERSFDGGNTWQSATAGIDTNDPAEFYPPYVVDGSEPGRLLLGTSRVYESLNSAGSWSPLSTPGVAGWITNAPITSVAAAPGNPNVIYAAAGGYVFVTTNHGASWSATTPVAQVSAIFKFVSLKVDPRNPAFAYVVAGNPGDVTGNAHVWITGTFGQTWFNISGNLPDLPTWAFALNPGNAVRQNDVWYVGTDAGVYYSANGGRSWAPLANGLPNAQVVELQYNSNLNILAAATNGRGMWELLIPAGITPVVTGAGPGGGPQVNVFDGRSGLLEFAFYAYEASFPGGVRVAVGDINGDGVPDIVTAPGAGRPPEIRVFDSRTGALERDFMAYNPAFQDGVYVAVADVNNDGFADIITGAGQGGGPEVRVFSGKDNSVLRDFFAYDPRFPGGVRIAAGDINGDGFADIVTGAGPGGGPHVEVWSGATGALLRSFYAYSPLFPGGVFVGAGDVNGDGLADVVTGAGPGGGPHVEIWSGANNALLASFMAFSPNFSGGVRVATGDMNGDGRADIVTGAGAGGGPELIVRDALSLTKWVDIAAYSPAFAGGLFVASPVLRGGGSELQALAAGGGPAGAAAATPLRKSLALYRPTVEAAVLQPTRITLSQAPQSRPPSESMREDTMARQAGTGLDASANGSPAVAVLDQAALQDGTTRGESEEELLLLDWWFIHSGELFADPLSPDF